MKYFLLAVLAPLILFASAQDGAKVKNVEKYPNVKWRKKLKIARAKVQEGSYYNAVQYLEDAYKEKPEKIEIPHLLGESYRFLRDYKLAEKYYKLVVDKDAEAYVDDQYWLAQMQKMNGNYDVAKKTYTNYLKAELGKKDNNFKAQAKIELVGCDTATALVSTPTKIKVYRTEGAVNTTIQDYAPKPLANNRVLFASQKTDTAVNTTVSKADYYVSLFTAEKAGNQYTNRQKLPMPPNSDTTNIGNGTLNLDETVLVFTKCDNKTVENEFTCRLFRSKKNGNTWGEGEELTALNFATGTTTQPAFAVDGDGNQILYFVSNRKGKKDLDIYYAKVNNDGTFGAITALDGINTDFDDITPSYDPKNKLLYFSSNGYPGLGGLDVFKSYGAPGKWGAVANAGVPINSSADDFYMAIDQKGAKGFLVSNRPGTTSPLGQTCCDDIWTVIVQRDVFLKAIYVKRGDATNTPVVGVDASMYKVAGNNFEFVTNTVTTSAPFVFPVNRTTTYKINGNKEGYWPAIDNITIAEDEERDTIEQIFYIDPIVKKKIRIPNVYFAFDKSNVIEFYQKEIDSVVLVLNTNPGYSVEVQGHTDSKGTDEYNEKLAKRRADEVQKFLIKKKAIAANRVVAKSYGEKQPAVPNELPTGEDDPEGRARNRRVEFKVIPDKPEDAPEFENYGTVDPKVKTGPGFTYGVKKK